MNIRGCWGWFDVLMFMIIILWRRWALVRKMIRIHLRHDKVEKVLPKYVTIKITKQINNISTMIRNWEMFQPLLYASVIQDFQERYVSYQFCAFKKLNVQYTSDAYPARIGLRLWFDAVRIYSLSIRNVFFFLKILNERRTKFVL